MSGDFRRIQRSRKIKNRKNTEEKQKSKHERKSIQQVQVSHRLYIMTGSSHVSRSRAIRSAERNTKATNTHTDTETGLDTRNRTQRVDGSFHTPWYENIEDFRPKRERRTRTNSLTGKIEIEEEENKEIYNSKRKILSPASEEGKRRGRTAERIQCNINRPH